MNARRSLWAAFFVMVLFSVGQGFATSLRSQSSKQAYVTLLYGDEFLLGVRVLGKSIRDTGSKKDTVVLVSDGVSDYAKKLLKADGWIVEKINLVENPNHLHPKRFWGVYTKLNVFNMTSYSKGTHTMLTRETLLAIPTIQSFHEVVYLDADTIVVKNIEDLFKCGKFCANLKHSERLNSGVMVVEPSKTIFDDMMSKVKNLYSYTGGDQGFLNSYYADFPNAHLFEPNLSEAEFNSRRVPEMERLSTLYNADVGLYMLANKWMVDESELRIIHYTLGPLKPWDWWTSWLLKPVDVWQNVRDQLEDSLPGTRGGRNPGDNVIIIILYLLPLLVLFFFNYRSFFQLQGYSHIFCRTSLCDYIRHLYYKLRLAGMHPYNGSTAAGTFHPHTENGVQCKVPTYLGGISICACFVTALIALAFSLAIVPQQVTPWTGLLLMYEWTFTVFFLLYAAFLHWIFQWGKASSTQVGYCSSNPESFDYSAKDHLRRESSCDTTAWFYGFGMAFVAVATPSLPCIFGITALFVRLGLMVVGGLLLASFMTYASERLAMKSFLRGLEHREDVRGRSICCLC